jgi:hypothetical protein
MVALPAEGGRRGRPPAGPALNLLRGRCEVAESVTDVDGRLVWGPTKTYARRTVHLPRFLCEQVGGYLSDRPHGRDDLVFTAPQGGPLREQKFTDRFFKPAATKAGLPHRLRFHDLRHTCASLLIARARASRRSRPSSVTLLRRSRLTGTGTCSRTSWRSSRSGSRKVYADATTDPARTEAASADARNSKGAGQ